MVLRAATNSEANTFISVGKDPAETTQLMSRKWSNGGVEA